MEFWSYPPNYDDDYMPPAGSPYWFPVRETMDPGERERAIVGRLREVMRHAWDNSPFYKKKWDEAGVHPDHITSLEAFERVPVVTKADLRASQLAHPPFGDYLCIPDSEIHRIHGTSGTTGRPTAFALGRDDWRTIANNHARVMWAMGIRPGDTVIFVAIFSLYLGSWGAMQGAERMRCKSFPFGAGAPGMTARAVSWMSSVKPQALYGTVSYALRLAEVARDEGIVPREFGLKVMFFSGEPGASVPSIRKRIEESFGARVIDCGTMAEMTPFMSSTGTEGSPEGMVLFQDIVYHEVCDAQNFARVPYGERGTPVYTHLERTSQPMIRLMSGDLTHWEAGPSPCGRTYPRFPNGVYGRIDDMFQIRGENVYPSEIENVLGGMPGYGGEHRILISRAGTMDELLLRVEADATVGLDTDAFGRRVAQEVNKLIGLRARVEVVPARTFERTEFKARRVIDDRDMFREMREKLGGQGTS